MGKTITGLRSLVAIGLATDFTLSGFSVTIGDRDRESGDFGGYGGVCGPRFTVLKIFSHIHYSSDCKFTSLDSEIYENNSLTDPRKLDGLLK